jgi:DNA repair and recombination protein RAD54B
LQKKKAGLAALGEWTHINCLRSTARDDIQDDILRKLIQSTDPTRKPSKQPKSRLDSLLSAIDLENIVAKDEVWTVRDVPGGTVSFLFEKTSLTGSEEVLLEQTSAIDKS